MTAIMNPREEMQLVIDRLVHGRKQLTVLEAGCGSTSHVKLPTDADIIGIDISPEQLDRNTYLKEKILGDIQVHELEKERFDFIICWDVLEHLPNPGNALENFVHAAKPNGLVLLALPNVHSLKGLITKYTPHAFHIWIYRFVYRSKNAGRPGFAPFETYLKPSISPGALQKFARENGFIDEFTRLYESGMITKLKNRSKLLYAGYRAALAALRVVSLGAYDGANTDIIMVLRKPGGTH